MDMSIKSRNPYKGMSYLVYLSPNKTYHWVWNITIILVLHSRSIMWYSKKPCWFSCKLSTNALQSFSKITLKMFNSCAHFIAWKKAHAPASFTFGLLESCIVFVNVLSSLCRQRPIPNLFSLVKSVASTLIFR